jgi:poly [ADP-ribose] polymerase
LGTTTNITPSSFINYHGDKPRGLPHRVVTIGQVDSGLPLRQAKLRKRQSCGDIDAKTLSKIAQDGKKPAPQKPTLPQPIIEIVEYLYSESVKKLTTTVSAQITANGIETPLGVLTLGQIDKGQSILDQIAVAINKKRARNDLLALSGQFYTAIPHRLGRSRTAIEDAAIVQPDDVVAKNETLQLMRDMLNVNGKSNVLVSSDIEQKYHALNCQIACVDSDEFGGMKKYVEGSAIKYKGIKVKNLWKICRPTEQAAFDAKVGNEKMLFHGSSVANWVGILSRGILLPKAVVALGVRRTDAGWLGAGIYFGDAICTSYYYAGSGRRGTKFISVARVALGKVKQYRKITYGLTEPPAGFDSCHGVRGSEFSDDEFVVYKQNQQKLEYLLEVA